jgi:hypothetical protein
MSKECMKSQKNEIMVFLYRKPKRAMEEQAIRARNDGQDAG